MFATITRFKLSCGMLSICNITTVVASHASLRVYIKPYEFKKSHGVFDLLSSIV